MNSEPIDDPRPRELQPLPPQGGDIQPARDLNVAELVSFAITNPEVDPAKLEKLFDLHIKMEDRASKAAFDKAMAALQANMPRITKTRVIPDNSGKVRSMFTPIEDLDLAIRPLLAEHGFSIKWNTEHRGDRMAVIGRITHAQGHFETSMLEVKYSKPPGASDAQGDGSTLAYGKRQVLMDMLNIVPIGVDNDGQIPRDNPISPEEVADIKKELERLGANIPRFLEYLKLPSLEDVRVSELPKVRAALASKAKQRGGQV